MGRKPKHPTFDIDMVRAAASHRWPEILSHVGGIDRELLDGEHHGCPKPNCGGTDRFRMIDASAGALFCNQCFRDKNGDGFAAVQWLLDVKFPDALAKVAEYLGIEASKSNGKRSKADADPAEHLKFLDWHEGLAATWCTLHKPGITPAAMVTAGCRRARYRDQFTVFAIPVYGAHLHAADPVGWCLYNVGGGTLPKFTPDKKIKQVKTKLTYGSKPGIIGPVDRLAEARVVWKVEGPSDLLALLSLGLPDDTTAITNANGAGERPTPWLVPLLAGKVAYVLHDADVPGEKGAAAWSSAMATYAEECRHVHLPYEVEPDHGSDLRDWIQGR